MVSPGKALFLITDGGRARLVERRNDPPRYVTFEEIDGAARLKTLREELRASPPTRSFSSTTPARAAVGREDYVRPAKEAFIGEVADRAAEVCRLRGLEGVVIAAPARLIGPLRARLEGRARLAGAIRKDLTKAPDSTLGAWLDETRFNP